MSKNWEEIIPDYMQIKLGTDLSQNYELACNELSKAHRTSNLPWYVEFYKSGSTIVYKRINERSIVCKKGGKVPYNLAVFLNTNENNPEYHNVLNVDYKLFDSLENAKNNVSPINQVPTFMKETGRTAYLYYRKPYENPCPKTRPFPLEFPKKGSKEFYCFKYDYGKPEFTEKIVVGGNDTETTKSYRNKQIDDALSQDDYTIISRIAINGNSPHWRNIFHYGNTGSERMPAMWIFPNNPWKMHFRIRTTTSINDGYDFHIPVKFREFDTIIEIKIKVTGVKTLQGSHIKGSNLVGSGNPTFEATVNGVKIGKKVSKGTIIQLLPRTFYIKNPYENKSGYSVKSVLIGNDDLLKNSYPMCAMNPDSTAPRGAKWGAIGDNEKCEDVVKAEEEGSKPAFLIRKYTFNGQKGEETVKEKSGYAKNTDAKISGNDISIGDGYLQFTGESITSKPMLDLGEDVNNDSFSISVEMWVTADPDNAGWSRLFQFGNDQGNSIALHRWADTGKLCLSTFLNNKHLSVKTEVDFNKLEMAHVVGIFNRIERKGYIYVNGSLEGSGPIDFPTMTKKNYVGKSLMNQDAGFKGKIHEFRIYNGVLNIETIDSNLKNGADKESSNLIIIIIIIVIVLIAGIAGTVFALQR